MKKPKQSEDFLLIQRAKKDINAFGYIYEKYYTSVFRFVYSKINDRNIAADLVSQTFLKAMLNIKRYKDRGKPLLAWLFMIATNEVRMHYRKQKGEINLQLDVRRFNNLIAETHTDSSKAQSIDLMVESLNSLSQVEIELIELRFFDELSFSMIAAIYNTSEATVKMRLYRILKRLKSQLAKLEKST